MMPDKIYLNKYMLRKGMMYPAQLPADVPEEEYIRKDALMEWAKDFKAKTGWYEIEVAMDDLIDKLNSM